MDSEPMMAAVEIYLLQNWTAPLLVGGLRRTHDTVPFIGDFTEALSLRESSSALLWKMKASRGLFPWE